MQSVEVACAVYRDILATYRTADREEDSWLRRGITNALKTNLPSEMVELKLLGRILKRRGIKVLAYFARQVTPTGPPEDSNGKAGIGIGIQ